ncbi:MAG: ABC transporter substrate-binding protein [Chloroflexi bacterium]|nr:ABC transporter substrate-binding protein [Chloroflexota bacterium]
MSDERSSGTTSRRGFLRNVVGVGAGLAGGYLLAACAPQPAASPTAAPKAAAPAPAQAPAAVAPKELVVSTWGASAAERVVREAIMPKFEKANNAKVVLDLGNQAPRFAKLQAQKGSGSIDIFMSADELLYTGLKQDLFEPVDDNRIPNLKNLQEWARPVPGQGPAYTAWTMGIGYNSKLVKDPPKKWADLWRPEFAGKLAMPGPGYSLFPSLLLRAAELNGGGKDNQDPGFAKLAELKPAKAFSIFTEWVPLFQSEEIVVVPDLDSYIFPLQDQGMPIQYVFPEDGLFGSISIVSIVKGTKNRELAHEFINVSLEPDVQAFQATTYTGPAIKNVTVDANLAKKLGSYGDLAKQLRIQDGKWASENRNALVEKFNTLVSPKWAK